MGLPEEITRSSKQAEIHERYLDLLDQGLGVDEARGMIAQQLAAELYDDERPQKRDFSIVWTNLPLPRLLLDRLDREQERLMEAGEVSHTKARQGAREKIEGELTNEEYEDLLREIQSRPPRDSMMPPPIMSENTGENQTPPPQAA